MKIIKRVTSVVVISASVVLGTGVAAGAVPAAEQRIEVAGSAGLPPFIAIVKPVTAERLGKSWRAGCPVGPDQLRLINMSVLGFDGKVYRGELVVAAAVTQEIVGTFADLYHARYPIERMVTVEKYDADDDKSMEANNTSATVPPPRV